MSDQAAGPSALTTYHGTGTVDGRQHAGVDHSVHVLHKQINLAQSHYPGYDLSEGRTVHGLLCPAFRNQAGKVICHSLRRHWPLALVRHQPHDRVGAGSMLDL